MTSVRTKRVALSQNARFNPDVSQNWLAGQPYYLSTYAGNENFHPTTFGEGKLFGLGEGYISEESLCERGYAHRALNEEYVGVLNMVSAGSMIALWDWESDEEMTVVTLISTLDDVLGTHRVLYAVFQGGDGLSNDQVNAAIEDFQGSLNALAMEFQQDSMFENTLETTGYAYGGVLGFVVGGVVGGLLDGKPANVGANLAEAVSSSLKGQVLGAAAKQLGLAMTPLGAVAIVGLGMLLDEAMEMALGLDNHFGFGGELVGFDDGNDDAQYSTTRDFGQGLLDTVSTTGYGLTQAVRDLFGYDYDSHSGLSTFGDNFAGTQYSQEAIDKAMEQSAASAMADNPESNGGGNESDFGGGFNGGAGGAGGFGSQSEAAAGGHMGGW